MAHDPVLDMPAPRSLVLRMDITNNCNLDCIGCALISNRQLFNEPASPMKMEVFERIAEEVFPYLREVALSCEAEPTLHPQFARIMQIIAEKTERGTKPPVRMTTNATLLTPGRLDAIFDAGILGLSVSIDGFTSDTFSKIRRKGDVFKVYEALDEIVRRKAAMGRRGLDRPQIQINYTLMKSNLHELIPMIEHSRRWELENFTVVHVYSAGDRDMSHESLSDWPDMSDRILIEAERKCREYGMSPRFPQLFGKPAVAVTAGLPAAPDPLDLCCAAPWRMLKIRWNGDVYPCDLWGMRDSFGNLQTQSFRDIWMSGKYIELRSGLFTARPTFENCIKCDRISQDNLEGRKLQSPLVHTSIGR